MPVNKKLAEAVGKLFRNLGDHKWYLAEAAKQTVSIVVIHPLGHQAYAKLKGHLFSQEKDRQGRVIKEHLVADAYRTDDGHEHLSTSGKHYRYDLVSDSWVNATPPPPQAPAFR